MKLKKVLKEDFNNYDFSETVYTGCQEDITFVCKKCHNVVTCNANTLFLYIRTGKSLCNKCRRKLSKCITPTTEEYKEMLLKKFGDRYDYSKVEYIDVHTPVILTCPIHGDFKIIPTHLNSYPEDFCFCPLCREEKKKEDKTKHLISSFNKRHPELKGVYKDIRYITSQKMDFICPIHGKVESATETFYERGCRKCNRQTEERNYTDEEFVNILKEIYGDKYDYSKVKYKTFGKDKVCLTCSKHGDFWRLPVRLLEGRGCPKCKESLLEKEIRNYLDDCNINYTYQYRNRDILGYKSLDFYLHDYNAAIECQGKQHFDQDSMFNENIDISSIYNSDKQKYDVCLKNGIKIYYFTHIKSTSYEYIDKLHNSKEELIDVIRKEYEERLL